MKERISMSCWYVCFLYFSIRTSKSQQRKNRQSLTTLPVFPKGGFAYENQKPKHKLI